MRLIRAGTLPAPAGRRNREPRSALWISLQVHEQEWQLLNVHLGLSSREREMQARALLGDQWLGDPRYQGPSLLCGDLNSGPGSRPHRLLSERLCNVQERLTRRRRTFPSRFTLLRLDHVFVSSNVEVINADVPNSQLAQVASDHRPLLVEVRLVQG
jgi:endonuclease/exonuclease/phosphatase family metal-dependent hydrolase